MKSIFKGRTGAYQAINLIIAGVIILIFIYSGIFNTSENNYPLKCVHEQLSGMSCPSCGLSRSFSEMVRFNVDTARDFNHYGPRVFLFFVFQLVLRISILIYLRRNPGSIKIISGADIIISSVAFLFCFSQFIEYTLRLIF
ncbi:MAG: DUF2752 domain-containing protein [Marinilabiliaceae bacterium]|nr:DUF2752 domain-containing protein [Marinilabiliaceae bacterium]